MTGKPSPGPWETSEGYDHDGDSLGPPFDCVYDADGQWIGEFYSANDLPAEANARLAAAAPELLEALEALIAWQQPSTMPTLADLCYVDDDRVSATDCGGHVQAVVHARAAIAKARGTDEKQVGDLLH